MAGLRRPFLEGDEIKLTPSRLGKRGEAEGEYRGWRVRVEGGIPGEASRVRVLHVSKGGQVAAGRFLGPVDAPHPSRREPVCPIHDRCGGCGLQQMRESGVLELKVDQARSALGDRGSWSTPIASPRAFEYRCKTFLLPQRRGTVLLLGARPPRGERLVETRGCSVLRPELEALAERARVVLEGELELEPRLRSLMLRCNRAGQVQLTLVHRDAGEGLESLVERIAPDAGFLQRHDAPGNRICSDEEERLVVGRGPIEERFGDSLEIEIPPTAFLQGNPEVAEALYRAAAAELEGERIGELYCGGGAAGLLTLTDRPETHLHGVDRSPRAIAAAGRNADRNGLADRCHFETIAAESARGEWDSVLVNPPRAGCHADVVTAIAESRASKLVYLSCNAQTLARDIDRLGWRLATVQPADMFPQTAHLELLATLIR